MDKYGLSESGEGNKWRGVILRKIGAKGIRSSRRRRSSQIGHTAARQATSTIGGGQRDVHIWSASRQAGRQQDGFTTMQ